nr:MAG TPA: hypothetical protein [Bacteriophage sp.]
MPIGVLDLLELLMAHYFSKNLEYISKIFSIY